MTCTVRSNFFFPPQGSAGIAGNLRSQGTHAALCREQFGGSLGGPFITDKLFAFFAGEYLNQDHAVPVGRAKTLPQTTVSGGSATAFVRDVRITSKGDWVPDPNDHILSALLL